MTTTVCSDVLCNVKTWTPCTVLQSSLAHATLRNILLSRGLSQRETKPACANEDVPHVLLLRLRMPPCQLICCKCRESSRHDEYDHKVQIQGMNILARMPRHARKSSSMPINLGKTSTWQRTPKLRQRHRPQPSTTCCEAVSTVN